MDDVVPVSDDPNKLYKFLDGLKDRVSEFGTSYTFSKFNKLLHDWNGLRPNFIFEEEELSKLDKLCCLHGRLNIG